VAFLYPRSSRVLDDSALHGKGRPRGVYKINVAYMIQTCYNTDSSKRRSITRRSGHYDRLYAEDIHPSRIG
jgi:hypothetical protein